MTSQDGYSEFPAAVGDAVAGGVGVALVSNVRQEIAQVDGDGGNLTGLDERINEVYELRWEQGSDAVAANLGADGAIVPNNVAEDKDLAVGDPVTVRSMDSETREFVVRGIYEGSPFYPLLGTLSVSQAAFDELHARPRNRFTLVNVEGDTGAARPGVERTRRLSGHTTLHEVGVDREGGRRDPAVPPAPVRAARVVDRHLFGMVNTLALSVFERTRELGMLRAVGMTRRQARRMIRHESIITALIGAALGLPLGIFLAAPSRTHSASTTCASRSRWVSWSWSLSWR